MKLTYLGTAAAEGFPAIFCNCEYCNEARRLGGKNIRSRSQALVNGDLLIDFPPDSYYHFINNGIEAHKIKHLLITHGHSDHWSTAGIYCRRVPYSHNAEVEVLDLICSEVIAESIVTPPKNVSIRTIRAFETLEAGEYKITALPARHMTPESQPFIYIIQGDRTLLYAHDTGYFLDEALEYIEKSGVKFDMISLDCTNVNIPIADTGSHMGLENIKRLIARLEDIGAVDGDTARVVNHFSHNGNPLQEYLDSEAGKIGCLASYDGFTVEL